MAKGMSFCMPRIRQGSEVIRERLRCFRNEDKIVHEIRKREGIKVKSRNWTIQ